MNSFGEIISTVVCAFVTSYGFWAWMMRWSDRKSVKSELLLGLAHDRIMYLGMQYIERKWITADEFENLHEYLYKPYEKMGGNGSAKRVMDAVKQLPIKPSNYNGGGNYEQ